MLNLLQISFTFSLCDKKNLNGIYNQDISNNAMLIEVGGYENTIDEVYNTMEILAIILKDIINERG